MMMKIFLVCLALLIEQISTASMPLRTPFEGFGSYGAHLLPVTTVSTFANGSIFKVNYDSSLEQTPIALTSCTNIYWSNEFSFGFQTLSVTDSFLTFYIANISASVTSLKFSHVYYERYRFSTTSTRFQFIETGEMSRPYIQDIIVTNFELYTTPILKGYSDVLIANQHNNFLAQQPYVESESVDDGRILNTMNISVKGNNGYYITYIRIDLVNVTSSIYISNQSYYQFEGFSIQNTFFSAHSIISDFLAINNTNSFCGLTIPYHISSENNLIKIDVIEGEQRFTSYLSFHLAFIITGCNETYPLYHEVDRRCYDLCPDGFLGGLFSYYTCVGCTSPCHSCSKSLTNCTSCLDGRMGISNIMTNQWTCLCDPDSYGDPTVSCTLCRDSIPNCYSCQNAQRCTQCEYSFLYNEDANACECPDGYTEKINPHNSLARCVKKRVAEQCKSPMVKAASGLHCECPGNTDMIDGRCL